MKYFIVQQDSYLEDTFRITDWEGKVNRKWININQLYKIPKRVILQIEVKEGFIFPDFITSPFLMVSECFYKVIKMYGDMFYYRDIILMNIQKKEFNHYYLLLLNGSEREGMPLREHNIFQLELEGKTQIIISQDFAESILRRGAKGIRLKEVDNLFRKGDCRNGE